MLRFKGYLNERYTQAQIQKGLGSALKNYDNISAKADFGGPQKDVTSPGAKMDDSKYDEDKFLDLKGKPYDYMKDAPKPPVQKNQSSTFSMAGALNQQGRGLMPDGQSSSPHQAIVHLKNPQTGETTPVPSPHPLQVSIHNPATGSSISIGSPADGHDEQSSSQISSEKGGTGVRPSQNKGEIDHRDGQSPSRTDKPQTSQLQATPETYPDMIHRSLKPIRDLGVPVPHFSKMFPYTNRSMQQSTPTPQVAPAPTPQAAPIPQDDQTRRPGEPQNLGFSQKARDAYRKADAFGKDPEGELKKMLGSKYVAP